MNRLFNSFSLVCLCWSMCVTATGQAQKKYEIDNTHSSIIFSISHFNIGFVYGRFNKVAGIVSIDEQDPAKSVFDFEIESESVDTNDPARDEHLRGLDFLDAANYSKIEFKSESVTLSKGVYQVTGKLKLLKTERELKIPFQLLGVGPGPFGKSRMGMLGKFRIKRSEFGMTEMLTGIGDDIAITFALQGVLK